MAFKSGAEWNGNKKGRPKGETLGDIYRKNKQFPSMADKVFRKLLKSEDENIVLSTIKFMVEIRDGKAPQPLEHSGGIDIDAENAKSLVAQETKKYLGALIASA